MIIDVHAHFYPRPYLERLLDLNSRDLSIWGRCAAQTLHSTVKNDRRMYDIEAHIADMDEAGVDVEALSLSIPYPYFDDERATVELTRLANDELADVCARFPQRFKVFAALPLPHVDAALQELDRAIDVLHLHGVGLGANVRGIPLDDKRFAPIYREIHRRNLAVFMHPMNPPGVEEMLDPDLRTPFGFLVDGAFATMRLVQRGIFAENPDMNFIVPHLGTFIIAGFDRLTGGGRRTTEAGSNPADDLRSLYYDAVNGHVPTWHAALETVGAGHIVYGSDYPWGRMSRTIDIINALDISDEDRQAIFHGTAERLLK
jgi:aminocarboxymuconate-semialdehyde decarboxylase